MKVCSNTSPIIFLSKINQLGLLNKCFSETYIPEAVNEELADEVMPKFINKLKISEFGKAFVSGSLGSLHQGELEAIILAREINADFVILDDNLARKKAQRIGINIIGTLGVLLLALKKHYLTSEETKMHIDTLVRHHDMYISNSVLENIYILLHK